MSKYYLASCIFTTRFPELSFRIQKYVEKRFGFSVVQCCLPEFKQRFFDEKMLKAEIREDWNKLDKPRIFAPGDEVWSVCHTCSNIVETVHKGVKVRSLWELIDSDDEFPIPDYSGLNVTVQDCVRARKRFCEQKAVRNLLDKMQISWQEAAKSHEKTRFCGEFLSSPQSKEGSKNNEGKGNEKFERYAGKMKKHSEQFKTNTVVCYCHYCLAGLEPGGVEGRHMAHMLFPELKQEES